MADKQNAVQNNTQLKKKKKGYSLQTVVLFFVFIITLLFGIALS